MPADDHVVIERIRRERIGREAVGPAQVAMRLPILNELVEVHLLAPTRLAHQALCSFPV